MYVGFDIGGTTIKYGVLDETGAILEKNMLPTNYDPQSFYQNLITIINESDRRDWDQCAGHRAKRRFDADSWRHQTIVRREFQNHIRRMLWFTSFCRE